MPGSALASGPVGASVAAPAVASLAGVADVAVAGASGVAAAIAAASRPSSLRAAATYPLRRQYLDYVENKRQSLFISGRPAHVRAIGSVGLVLTRRP